MDLSTIEARKALAGKWAAKYGLDVALVCAVAHHESSWNPWAIRYEPSFYTRYIQPLVNNGTVHTMTEAQSRAISWGLMQVMGEVAREQGFTGPFLSQLADPDTGLDYGCRKLQKSVNAHPGDTRAALAAYNGGGDPQYPDLVLQWVGQYS